MLIPDQCDRYFYELYQSYKASLGDGAGGALDSRASANAVLAGHNHGRCVLIPNFTLEATNITPNPAHLSQHESWIALDHLFLGNQSSLACLTRTVSLNFAQNSSLIARESQVLPVPTSLSSECPEFQLPPLSVTSAIFHLFSRSVNIFYPVLKHQHLQNLISNTYHAQGSLVAGPDHELLCLILAIGAQLTKRSESGLPFTSEVYFQNAIHRIDRSRRTWISIDGLYLLQRHLLICIYVLLTPSSGDIWRHLGFAIRLYFDLSHRPSENDDMDEELMCMLTRTLYCLEWYEITFLGESLANIDNSQVSIAFGRPSLLVIGDKLREVSLELNDRAQSWGGQS